MPMLMTRAGVEQGMRVALLPLFLLAGLAISPFVLATDPGVCEGTEAAGACAGGFAGGTSDPECASQGEYATGDGAQAHAGPAVVSAAGERECDHVGTFRSTSESVEVDAGAPTPFPVVAWYAFGSNGAALCGVYVAGGNDALPCEPVSPALLPWGDLLA